MAATGQSAPWKEEPPEIPNYLLWAWEGFVELTSCRNEKGFIPWTAIDRYSIRYNYSSDEFEEFRHIVTQLNKVLSEYECAQLRKKAAKGN